MATLRASSDTWASGGMGSLRRRASQAAHRSSYHAGRVKLFRRNLAGREVLLVDVIPEGREGRTVRLQAVGPEILAEHPPGLLDMIDQERQRQVQRIGVVEALRREVARRAECLVEALRDPRVLAKNVLADHDRVHDRKNPGAPVIVLLDRLVVGEQPT